MPDVLLCCDEEWDEINGEIDASDGDDDKARILTLFVFADEIWHEAQHEVDREKNDHFVLYFILLFDTVCKWSN